MTRLGEELADWLEQSGRRVGGLPKEPQIELLSETVEATPGGSPEGVSDDHARAE